MHSYINDLTDIEGHLLHNAIVTRLGKFTVRPSAICARIRLTHHQFSCRRRLIYFVPQAAIYTG